MTNKMFGKRKKVERMLWGNSQMAGSLWLEIFTFNSTLMLLACKVCLLVIVINLTIN